MLVREELYYLSHIYTSSGCGYFGFRVPLFSKNSQYYGSPILCFLPLDMPLFPDLRNFFSPRLVLNQNFLISVF
jgi:hypothetical protein